MILLALLLPVLGTLASFPTSLVPNSLFGDHMVLQTSDDNGEGAKLSGLAPPGQTVTVTFDPKTPSGNTKMQAQADGQGFWRVNMNEASSGPFTVTLESGSDKFTYSDVYFGDVFLCSGQSNMQFPTYLLDNKTEVTAANYPNIRLYNVNAWGSNKPIPPVDWAPEPYTNINGTVPWQLTTPDTINHFSAVCYLTARKLMEYHTKGRALGLVESCIGGTPVQAWTPRRGLAKCQLSPDMPISDQTEKPDTTWMQPAVLYNQMIAPFNNASFRAVMWYQGEANMDEGYALEYEMYECLFRNMILEWRQDMNDFNLPFVFMQISACGHNPVYNWRWDAIRAAQARVEEATPWTGMGLAFDRGFTGIHSKYKEDPSTRLMYRLLEEAYDIQLKEAVRPRVEGVCAMKIGGYDGNPTNMTTVFVKVSGADKLIMLGTEGCNNCCNKTHDQPSDIPGVAMGAAQLSVATTKVEETWINAAIELTDGGFLMHANVGNITADKTFLFGARFEVGPYPQCAIYNQNMLPIGPFGPINVSPACEFPTGRPIGTLPPYPWNPEEVKVVKMKKSKRGDRKH